MASFVESAPCIASAFDAPNAATMTKRGVREDRKRQRQTPRRWFGRVVDGDDGLLAAAPPRRGYGVQLGGQVGSERT